jgi:hypothetical protein
LSRKKSNMVGVQSAIPRPETAALLRKMMEEAVEGFTVTQAPV